MSSTSEHLDEIICAITTSQNIKNWSYKLDNFQVIAQNYFGVLIPVVIEGERVETNDLITLKIVLKLAPTDERYRVSGALTLMFQKEIYVYTNVLTFYKKLYSKGVIYPECFYVKEAYCNEVIALQDMRELGFGPFATDMFLDLEHMNVSIKALAQFHALSFILRQTDRNHYASIVQTCIPLNETTNQRLMIVLDDRLNKALQKFCGSSYYHVLESLKKNCNEHVTAIATNTKELCICHGDIWKDNILFRYNKDSQPIAACLIDFQTVRMSSPAYDVLYLITTSAENKLRRYNYHDLIDTYYNAFSDLLQASNVNAKEVYSKENLYDDLKVVAPACLIIANTALWLSCGLQQDGHVQSKKKFVTDSEKEEAANYYKNIIESILNDFESFGYLEVEQLNVVRQ